MNNKSPTKEPFVAEVIDCNDCPFFSNTVCHGLQCGAPTLGPSPSLKWDWRRPSSIEIEQPGPACPLKSVSVLVQLVRGAT